MDNLITTIKETVQKLFAISIEPVVTRPDSQFGDFSTNVAMQLAGTLGKNPRDVAEAIAEELRSNNDMADVTIAGPGFLNIRLGDSAVARLLQTSLVLPQTLAGKVVVAEYSDPNPFKVLHAGHLYTSIVGDVIANVLQTAGATVHRVNFGGDVGLHVGKTMWAILQNLGGEYPEKLQNVEEATRLEWLSARYVEGNEAYETNEEAKQLIIVLNKKVYELHAAADHENCIRPKYTGHVVYGAMKVSINYMNSCVFNPLKKYMPEKRSNAARYRNSQKGDS